MRILENRAGKLLLCQNGTDLTRGQRFFLIMMITTTAITITAATHTMTMIAV